jgi:cytochrome c-type biogenesis protein CcmH/NrfG
VNPYIGWGIAAVGLAVGAAAWGVRGAALAVSVIVFWLLLQLTRSMRVMRRAADRPVGYVESAVMLHSKLARGMLMLDVMKLTRSIGRRVDPARDDVWAWADDGGVEVIVAFDDGRCVRAELKRPPEAAE